MKQYLFLLLTVATLFITNKVFADGGERLALKMVGQSLTLRDTASARAILNKIAPTCEQSDSWEVRFEFYSLLGYLNSLDTLNLQKAGVNFFKAWLAFPDTVSPTQKYLTIAQDYCEICYDLQQNLTLAEYVARKSLVRASSIVNDCSASAGLFSLLAKFYEQRGDTIMPPHFHRKSQELSVKYFIRSSVPTDSLEIHYRRLKSLMERIDNSKSLFNRNAPEYLIWLDNLNNQVNISGNNRESIYLAEYIVQMARDSMLLDSPEYTFNAYYTLIYSYAAENHLEQALNILPEAKDYYDRHPDVHITKAVLYYFIGHGLFNSRNMQPEKVIHYLQLAKEELSEKYHSEYILNINKMLALCNAN